MQSSTKVAPRQKKIHQDQSKNYQQDSKGLKPNMKKIDIQEISSDESDEEGSQVNQNLQSDESSSQDFYIAKVKPKTTQEIDVNQPTGIKQDIQSEINKQINKNPIEQEQVDVNLSEDGENLDQQSNIQNKVSEKEEEVVEEEEESSKMESQESADIDLQQDESSDEEGKDEQESDEDTGIKELNQKDYILDINSDSYFVFLSSKSLVVIDGNYYFQPVVGNFKINGYSIRESEQLRYDNMSLRVLSSHLSNLLPIQALLVAKQSTSEQILQQLLDQAKRKDEQFQMKLSTYLQQSGVCIFLVKQADIGGQRPQISKLIDNLKGITYIERERQPNGMSSRNSEIHYREDTEQIVTHLSQSMKTKRKEFSQQISDYQNTFLVIGGKNTGQSTFCLKLINTLFTRPVDQLEDGPTSIEDVLFLETDLGQPIFGVPGSVSLFRLTHRDWFLSNLGEVHIVQPLESYFIGQYSPTMSVQMYYRAIEKLVSFSQSHLRKIPLVINTHGFITNIGQLISYDLVRILNPFAIIFVENDGQKKAIEQIEFLKRNIQNHLHEGKRIVLNQKSFSKPEIDPLLVSVSIDTSIKNIIASPTKKNSQAKEKNKPNNQGKNQENQPNMQNFENNVKQNRKDEILYTYLTSGAQNSSNKIITHLFSNQYSSYQYANLIASQRYSAQFSDFQFFQIENDSVAVVLGLQFIASLFIGSVVALSQSRRNSDNDQEPVSCIGFGFIVDIDLKTSSFEVITPISDSRLQRVCSVYRSKDFDFSQNFFLENHLNETFEYNQLLLDIQGDFEGVRENFFPFLLPKVAGIGSQSLRNRARTNN